MSETGTAIDEEPVEAVIISGPRKGEIIRLPRVESGDFSPEELHALNEALDMFNAKLESLSREIRLTVEAVKPRSELR